MALLHLTIVTPERRVLDVTEVESVTAPGVLGELGILPNHAPLLTKLSSGLVRYRRRGKKYYCGLEGGFLEVSRNKVSIISDTAILPEEADQLRAEEARKRAREALKKRLEGTDFRQVEAEMRKALLELKLVEHSK